MPTIISLHDVLEPLKQALLASRDVIISSQICRSNLQKVFTLGDGCWLPTLLHAVSMHNAGFNRRGEDNKTLSPPVGSLSLPLKCNSSPRRVRSRVPMVDHRNGHLSDSHPPLGLWVHELFAGAFRNKNAM